MLKPLTQVLSERMSRSFGSITMPNMPLPEIDREAAPQIEIRSVAPSATLVALLLGRLMAPHPTRGELQDQRAVLLGRAHEIGEACDAFLAACAEEEQLALEQQHQEIREKGREQQAHCDNLKEEFGRAHDRWNQALIAKQNALGSVEATKRERQALGRWASDAELSGADARWATAQNRAKIAIEKEAAALHERNRAEGRVASAREELSKLAMEETRLRAAIEGRSYIDPELGLEVPVP